MGRKHTVSKIYPVSAQVLWEDILDPNALAESMKGSLTYSGLPTEPVYEGQRIVVSIKRWGWFPMGRWTMEVVRRDDERRVLESREFGSLIRNFHHRLEVESLGDSEARYSDHLDLDAGLFTILLLPTFVSMYERRHEQRLKRVLSSKPGPY
jgi:hypothetical protein